MGWGRGREELLHTHTHTQCLQRSKTPFILIKENSKRHKGKMEAKPAVNRSELVGASLLREPGESRGTGVGLPACSSASSVRANRVLLSRKVGASTLSPRAVGKVTPGILQDCSPLPCDLDKMTTMTTAGRRDGMMPELCPGFCPRLCLARSRGT